MEKNRAVNCSTFQKEELLIRDITDKINMARTVLEKATFAQDLKEEGDVLLSCTHYDKANMNCKNCHFIAKLREQAAELIIKAKKLA